MREVKGLVGGDIYKFNKVIIKDVDNLREIVSKLKEKWNIINGVVYGDITGGKKPMAVSILAFMESLKAIKNVKGYIFYVSSQADPDIRDRESPNRPLTEKILYQGEIIEVLVESYLERVKENIKAWNLQNVITLLGEMGNYTSNATYMQAFKYALEVYRVLEHLCRLDFRGLGSMETLLEKGITIDANRKLKAIFGWSYNDVKKLISILQKDLKLIAKAENNYRLLQENPKASAEALTKLSHILWWIAGGYEKTAPWISAQLYYRSLEMSIQALLIGRGIWTGDVDPKTLLEKGVKPDTVKSIGVQGILEKTDTRYKVELKASLKLAIDLYHDLPIKLEELDNITEIRNTSIIAHGLRIPRPGKNFKKIREEALKLAKYAAKKTMEQPDEVEELIKTLNALMLTRR